MSPVPSVILNNGVRMPLLGFGVYQVTNAEECERSVYEALHTHNDVVPAVNQIETHPFNQQVETQAFLHENKVQIESWGPFAEGRNNIFENELLRSIADKYQKTVAQVILRWLTQRGVVAIPKSVRPERIEENFNVFDVELSAEDMEAIATLDTKTSSFFDHRDPAMVKRLGEVKLST